MHGQYFGNRKRVAHYSLQTDAMLNGNKVGCLNLAVSGTSSWICQYGVLVNKWLECWG
ncbi:hypothetical protein BDZ97DRAFT_1849341 [Flammula alnicola]|nr:hypothetical protein BDZ97DRAFT_1849341 [Flammula alnicola]